MNKNDLFSVRMRYESKQELQVENLNRSSRLAVYHVIGIFFGRFINVSEDEFKRNAWTSIARDFFSLSHKDSFSERGVSTAAFSARFDDLFTSGDWVKILNIVEYIHFYLRDVAGITKELQQNPHRVDRYEAVSNAYHNKINEVMENENIGYRLLKGKFTPITNEEELEEISRATKTPYQSANNFIAKAIVLFSDRENPDYENTIKESILAVEAAARELVDNDKATLGEALKKLEENGVTIHEAFKSALSKLYGFTSDADGIRHGGKGEPIQQDQATARFMLITCSAFVNYLIANSPTRGK